MSVPSSVLDMVPPWGPGTGVDSAEALLTGNQGSLAPSFPVSESTSSATSAPGGHFQQSGSATRGPDGHPSTETVRPLHDVLSRRSVWTNSLANSQRLLGQEGSVPLRPLAGVLDEMHLHIPILLVN